MEAENRQQDVVLEPVPAASARPCPAQAARRGTPTSFETDDAVRAAAGLVCRVVRYLKPDAIERRATLTEVAGLKLTRRQREKLIADHGLRRAYRAWMSGRPRGRKCHAIADLLQIVEAHTGQKISERRLRKIDEVLRRSGVRGLIDTRGRPRGNKPVSAAALLVFVSQVEDGVPWREAHRRVRELSDRRGWQWPRHAITVASLMKSHSVALVETTADSAPSPRGQDSHLQKVGRN